MREVPSTPVSGSSSRLRTLLEHNHRPPMVIPDSAALKDGTSERRPLMPPLPRSRTQRPVVEPPPVHVASRWPKKPPVLERHRTKLALQAATASVARSSSMPVLFLREGDCKVELASAISQSRPKLLRPRDSGRLDPLLTPEPLSRRTTRADDAVVLRIHPRCEKTDLRDAAELH